jgi:hypothetical protein
MIKKSNIGMILVLIIVTFSSALYFYNVFYYITPYEAIQKASDAADSGTTITGVFKLKIQAIGSEDQTSYLNSELDYRDQRNLTIVIPSKLKKELINKYKLNLNQIFMGKNILIDGEAMRVKIIISVQGQKTSKYYYQTHVRVYNIDQIQIK